MSAKVISIETGKVIPAPLKPANYAITFGDGYVSGLEEVKRLLDDRLYQIKRRPAPQDILGILLELHHAVTDRIQRISAQLEEARRG